jgi:hypothetical protein
MDGIVLGDTIDSFRQKRFVTAERRAKGSELAAVSAVLLTTLPPRVARWGQACRRVTEGRRNRSSAAFRSGGTESSNPASSSGESRANLRRAGMPTSDVEELLAERGLDVSYERRVAQHLVSFASMTPRSRLSPTFAVARLGSGL